MMQHLLKSSSPLRYGWVLLLPKLISQTKSSLEDSKKREWSIHHLRSIVWKVSGTMGNGASCYWLNWYWYWTYQTEQSYVWMNVSIVCVVWFPPWLQLKEYIHFPVLFKLFLLSSFSNIQRGGKAVSLWCPPTQVWIQSLKKKKREKNGMHLRARLIDL